MTYHFNAYLILVVSLLLPKGFIVNAQDGSWKDSYKLDFSYDPDAANGPGSWGNVEGIGQWEAYDNRLVNQGGNQCAFEGQPTSPINLEQISQPCRDLHELLVRQISEEDCTRQDMMFDVTPYSLRASFPLTEDACTRPTLTVPRRFNEYSLLWMELHARSEHVVEGRRYDAELQMIHGGTGRDSGQIMAVSVLIEATANADDLEFNWMLQQWEQSVEDETRKCATRQNRQLREVSDFELLKDKSSLEQDGKRELQFDPSPCGTDRFGGGCEPLAARRRMYPYNLFPTIWYYAYSGSLTIPPCSSGVQWRVLDQPWQISRRQYKQLTRLLMQSRDGTTCEFDTAVNPTTGENFRPLQQPSQFFQQNAYRCTFDDFGYFVYPPGEQ